MIFKINEKTSNDIDNVYNFNGSKYFSLKYKFFFISLLIVVAFFVLLKYFHHVNVSHKIDNEEKLFTEKTMLTIQNAIKYNCNSVTALTKDWGEWDAMYSAVDNWNTDFEEENFPDSIFSDLNLNFVSVFSEKGEVLYSKKYSGNDDKVVEFNFDNQFKKQYFSKNSKNFNGIIYFNNYPVFLSIKKVLRSDMTGPENGFLLMGRIINDSFINEISNMINEKITFKNKDYLCGCNDKDNCVTLTRRDNTMSLIFPIKDFYGNKISYLIVDFKRNLFQVISNSTKLYTTLTLVVFIFLILTLFYILDFMILKRLETMSTSLNSIKNGDNLFTKFVPDGNDEITILQKSFNRLINRIELEEENKRKMEKSIIAMEKMATAGKITYNILHEINNPIRVIKNYLYAIEKKGYTENYGKMMKDELNHLSEITSQLLDFSRRESTYDQKIDLNLIIENTVESLKIAFSEKTYEVNIINDCTYAFIKGNKGKLKQVFFNILKNSLEAFSFKGKIDILLQDDQDFVSVKIIDDGPGISGNQIEKLFEPFYTKDKENGIGLGLSISYSIIKNHGGDIFVDSEVESGACFIIVLPKYFNGE